MRVEGECPECGAKFGLDIDTSLGALLGNKIEEMLDDESNKVYCPDHGGWESPINVEQVEEG